MSARVFVGDVLVGHLVPDKATHSTEFEFDAGYASNSARPILGRWFEDKIIARERAFRGAPLPNFFRNLLPEGALRKIVEARLGPSAVPEYSMLLRLGAELPGAIRIASDELDPEPISEEEKRNRPANDPFRFALTGVQPKLALHGDGERLTVPLEGQGGHWIAKFGTSNYRNLVENEFTLLAWAKECGLHVPDHHILSARDIANLPEEFESDQTVLIVRRFDRDADGGRVHQEDFAQIFDVAPEDKYVKDFPSYGLLHYGTVGVVVFALCGENDYREYLRRLVFMVLSGNADAHLKNWALIYPDGLHANLAPAYDLVGTIAYPSLRSEPAMRWFEPPEPTIELGKKLDLVTIDDLLAAASYTEVDTLSVMDELSEFAARVRSTWPKFRDVAPENLRRHLTVHLSRATLR